MKKHNLLIICISVVCTICISVLTIIVAHHTFPVQAREEAQRTEDPNDGMHELLQKLLEMFRKPSDTMEEPANDQNNRNNDSTNREDTDDSTDSTGRQSPLDLNDDDSEYDGGGIRKQIWNEKMLVAPCIGQKIVAPGADFKRLPLRKGCVTPKYIVIH